MRISPYQLKTSKGPVSGTGSPRVDMTHRIATLINPGPGVPRRSQPTALAMGGTNSGNVGNASAIQPILASVRSLSHANSEPKKSAKSVPPVMSMAVLSSICHKPGEFHTRTKASLLKEPPGKKSLNTITIKGITMRAVNAMANTETSGVKRGLRFPFRLNLGAGPGGIGSSGVVVGAVTVPPVERP